MTPCGVTIFPMARLARLTIAGYPHHVIQRGNNRQAIFMDDVDRARLLDLLKAQAAVHQVAINAYVLMSNHLHLLLTPATAEGMPRMMQAVGRSYVRAFNRRHGRSGTLWEGRYRSTVIEAERHLLACMAYIDLNPVRAGLVAEPAEHPWSSHAALVGLRADGVVTPHPLYWALGNTPFARQQAYADAVQAGISQQQHAALGRAVHSGWALGDEDFLAQVQSEADRRVTPGRPGRPRKPAESE